ncbi:cytochrome P450 [Russula vinacea]|nr:cytochrome P450 [Russula vinacea]
MDFILAIAGLAFLALAVVWIKQLLGVRSSLPLPPQPKGIPVIGNLLDLAGGEVAVKCRDWSRQFGDDTISLDVMGSTMVILNSAKAVSEIFDKRGSNYSDRPDMPMIVDLMGWDWTFALMRYGPRWKEHRRVFHSHFNHGVIEHQEIQLDISKQLLTLLLTSPKNYVEHMRQYGHTVVDNDDPYVRLVEEASKSTSEAAVPGAFLVDLFPSLKYVPEWMPGAGFKTKAKEWRKLSQAMINVPYDMVKGKFENGTAVPCFVSTCLEKNAASAAAGKGEILTEELIKDSAAVAYAAGADTSVSTLTTFILAMTLHPEAQKRAQAELDAVLGERLPTFADKDDLPYVTAIMKEGYYIPAGASVLGNTWAILHDETVFVEPEKFKPERFINRNLPDPADSGVFGFGRRTCAGKIMALDTIWIAIASVLSVYNITKAIDDNGNVITPQVKLKPGTICHPATFECVIEPRSATALALIQHARLEAQ